MRNTEPAKRRAGGVDLPTEMGETQMTHPGREGQVLDAVVSLVDSLIDDFDIVDLLTQLTERCAQLLDIASAGLLVMDPRGQLQLIAATSEDTPDLEVFQLQLAQGPCWDSYATGEPVSVSDLRAETARWPQFVPAAIAAGFASVHAVPMRAGGMMVGALGLLGTSVGTLNASDLLVGQALAHIASVAIVQEHTPTVEEVLPRLRSALNTRIVVEQAKGFLRERLDLPTDEAFALLRRYARTNNRHLSEVARDLVSTSDTRPAVLDDMIQVLSDPQS